MEGELNRNVRRQSKDLSFSQQFSFCHPVLKLLEHMHDYMSPHSVRYFISAHGLWWWTRYRGNLPCLLSSLSITECHYLFALVADIRCRDIQEDGLGALGLLKKENRGLTCLASWGRGTILLILSTHTFSFREKNFCYINANSGRAMNIQQLPKRKRGIQWNFRLNIKQ